LARGGWDERLGTGSSGMAGEDADLNYRTLRAGGTIRYEPRAVVRHQWQSRARRLSTRWSYGYGVGAMCGLGLRRHDPFVATMLRTYAGSHARSMAGAIRGRDASLVAEHWRALAGPAPGLGDG